MSRKLSRRRFLKLGLGSLGAAGLAACAPKTVIVEKEKVVTSAPEVVKETIVVEKEVQVTKIVEKEVEKEVEVTKIVEKEVEKIVAATPVAPPDIAPLEAPALTPPPDKVELVMWDAWGREVRWNREPIQEAADAWNRANPDVTVEYLPGLTELDAKLLTAVAAGDPPNCVIHGPTTELAYRGALTKLNDYLDLGGHDFVDMIPGCWESMTVKGDVYSIAWNTNNGAVFYNTDLFKEAGLDPDQPPTTINELDEYADALTKQDDAGNLTQIGFVPWFNIAGIFGTWASAFGAKLWDEENGKVQFDDPKSIEALEWHVGYAEKLGWDAINAFNDSLAGQDAFGAGKLAMLLTGPWMLSGYRSDYPDINWNTAPLPAYPDGPGRGTWLGGRWVIMPKGIADPDWTWEFVKFFGSKQVQLLYGVWTTNFVPWDEENRNEWFLADKQMMGFLDALPECWPIPKIPTSNHAFFTALRPMQDEARQGLRTPEEAMVEATRIAQEEVDRFLGSL
jgi:multiple sugar transport system substrate-binding protein